jgi:hypothetical protein
MAFQANSHSRPPMDKIQDLKDWASNAGGALNPRVEIYNDTDFGISLRVKNDGNGPLKKAQPIISCPFALSLSYLNALDLFQSLPSHNSTTLTFHKAFKPLIDDKDKQHVVGHFFLMQQFCLGEESFWAPYIRTLPQPNEPEKLGTPLYYTDEEKKHLAGTNLENAVRSREESWQDEWKEGCALLGNAPGSAAAKFLGICTWELYKWAATIFSSRSFVSTLIPREVLATLIRPDNVDDTHRLSALFSSADKHPHQHKKHEFWMSELKYGPYPVLFPLVDLANHSPSAQVTWYSNVSVDARTLSIITESDLPEGNQIFNNYAPKGNTELLLGYGFLLPDNDDVTIKFKPLETQLDEIRRRQLCYPDSKGGAEENAQRSFRIRTKPYTRPEGDDRLPEFEVFEDGCIDLISILVATENERILIDKSLNATGNIECLERRSAGFLRDGVPFARNILAVISILYQKLIQEANKILSSGNNDT